MRLKAMVLGSVLALGAGGALAAQVSPPAPSVASSPALAAQVRQGAAAVGSRDSAAPALRSQAQTPSDGFVAGAALAAWRNASAGLASDVAHPLGDGGEAATVRSDCFDEAQAFAALQEAAARLGAAPGALGAAAGLSDEVATAWAARRLGAPRPCG
jgi:hypothetical protein